MQILCLNFFTPNFCLILILKIVCSILIISFHWYLHEWYNVIWIARRGQMKQILIILDINLKHIVLLTSEMIEVITTIEYLDEIKINWCYNTIYYYKTIPHSEPVKCWNHLRVWRYDTHFKINRDSWSV